MIDLLGTLYPIAMLYERGGGWRVFYLVAIPAWFIDVFANYTTLALWTWDWPRWGEWTFSTRLNRLTKTKHPNQGLYIEISKLLNRKAPSGKHIEL